MCFFKTVAHTFYQPGQGKYLFRDGAVCRVEVMENLSNDACARYRLRVLEVDDFGKGSDLEIGVELVHEEPAETLGSLLDGVFVFRDKEAA